MKKGILYLIAAVVPMVMTACATTGGRSMDTAAIHVTVLSMAGCSATPRTIDLIRKTAREEGLAIDLDHQVIESPEEADEKRFLGSPSVRVNGKDIDPAAAGAGPPYGLT